VTAKKDELLGTFRAMRTTQQPQGKPYDLARFKVEAGSTELQQL
jgi:hypothetical protein